MAKILIADSCDLGRRYASEVLQYDGHQVLEAADFETLVVNLLVTKVDVILLDPSLQGATRPRLAGFLRRRPGETSVFLLAEAGACDLRPLASELGADGAFVKGDDAVALLRAIEHAAAAGPSDSDDDCGLDEAQGLDPWPLSMPPRRPWDRTGLL